MASIVSTLIGALWPRGEPGQGTSPIDLPDQLDGVVASRLPISIGVLKDVEFALRKRLNPWKEQVSLNFRYYPPKDPTQLDVEIREKGGENSPPYAIIYFGRHSRATSNPINYQGVERSLMTNEMLSKAVDTALGIKENFPNLCETAQLKLGSGSIFYISARELAYLLDNYKDAWLLVSSPITDECSQGLLEKHSVCGRQITISFQPNNSFYRGCLSFTDEIGASSLTLHSIEDSFVVSKNQNPLAIPGSPKIYCGTLWQIEFIDPCLMQTRAPRHHNITPFTK